jgi:tetratricopeptide (TPR) repeat protein
VNLIKIEENTLNNLDVCYFNLGKLDSALVMMQKALKHNPNHKQDLYNIGIVFYNLCHIDKAMGNWKNIINLYPDTPGADCV